MLFKWPVLATVWMLAVALRWPVLAKLLACNDTMGLYWPSVPQSRTLHAVSKKGCAIKYDALPFMVLQPFGLRMLRCWQLYVDKNRQPDHRDY